MAFARFYLKSGQSEKADRLIYMNYSYGGYRFKYSTGIKVHPDNWNEERQLIRESVKVGKDKARIYNQWLKELATTTERLIISSQTNRQLLTPDELRIELNKIHNRTQ